MNQMEKRAFIKAAARQRIKTAAGKAGLMQRVIAAITSRLRGSANLQGVKDIGRNYGKGFGQGFDDLVNFLKGQGLPKGPAPASWAQRAGQLSPPGLVLGGTLVGSSAFLGRDKKASMKRAQDAGLIGSTLSQLVPGVGPALYGATASPGDRVAGAMRGYGGSAVGMVPGMALMGTGIKETRNPRIAEALQRFFSKGSKLPSRLPGAASITSRLGKPLTIAGLIAMLVGGGLGTRKAVSIKKDNAGK